MNELSHVDKKGKPGMVDVGMKSKSLRTAKAQAVIVVGEKIMDLIEASELNLKKGPVFQTAIIAGTMAVKSTAQLIPFCHPLPLGNCKISIETYDKTSLIIKCYVGVEAKTGVEMEALTGVTVAALTVYDMCKAISHQIEITDVRLLSKSGGKNEYTYEP